MKHKQIVCLSTHYWDDPWFRKQHFMHRFVREGYKVAYVEPSYSIVRKRDEHRTKYQTNKAFTVSVDKKGDNLFSLKPPRGLPFWSRPVISKLNYSYFSICLASTLKKIGFEDYILWVYRPEYAPCLNYFDYGKLVYDCVDDLAAYKQTDRSKYEFIKECSEILARRSDLVIVTAATLYEKYEDMARNLHIVPNGFDLDLFSVQSRKQPEDIKSIPHPVIGFVGTLFSFLDYDLIEFIIKKNSDKSFVFIGNCEENSSQVWAHITNSYKNVHWLGRKKKEEIPSYLRAFDVCINPFKVNDVSRSVSPLKVYEYLAVKKPVISVRMESLERESIAQFLHFASTYDEFNEKLEQALMTKDYFEEKLNYSMVLAYSWDVLFKKVFSAVESI
ncbi:MAG: glycosyltransferase [Nitrospirota bacterium]